MIPLFRVFMAPDVVDSVGTVLASGHVAQGPVVAAFERDLEDHFGTPVVTVNSCTSALHLALHLAGVGPDDEVVTTAQTCLATNIGIVQRGAVPVFVDVDPDTGLIDPEDVRRNVTLRTRAIVAVDWAGHPCDYRALRSFGVPVIEDAAHAVGTTFEGKHVAASGGDYVCFSFQAVKHLTTGDGGALSVPPDQRARAERLRWFGLDRKANVRFRFEQDVEELGYKYQLNDLAAAVGRSNLPHLSTVIGKHRANATALRSRLEGVPGVQLPRADPRSSWWLFTIKVDDPHVFVESMAELGVGCSPVHSRNDRVAALRSACRLSPDLRGLDDFSRHQVSIPVGWWLSSADLDQVAQAVETCTR